MVRKSVDIIIHYNDHITKIPAVNPETYEHKNLINDIKSGALAHVNRVRDVHLIASYEVRNGDKSDIVDLWGDMDMKVMFRTKNREIHVHVRIVDDMLSFLGELVATEGTGGTSPEKELVAIEETGGASPVKELETIEGTGGASPEKALEAIEGTGGASPVKELEAIEGTGGASPEKALVAIEVTGGTSPVEESVAIERTDGASLGKELVAIEGTDGASSEKALVSIEVTGGTSPGKELVAIEVTGVASPGKELVAIEGTDRKETGIKDEFDFEDDELSDYDYDYDYDSEEEYSTDSGNYIKFVMPADPLKRFTFSTRMLFTSVNHFRAALKEFAIREAFQLVRDKNEKRRVTAHCGGAEGCTWRIHASRESHDGQIYRIKKYNPRHTCVRADTLTEVDAKWIAEKLVDVLRENPNMKTEGMRDELTKYNVSPPYMQLYRAKRKALEMIEANHGTLTKRARRDVAEDIDEDVPLAQAFTVGRPRRSRAAQPSLKDIKEDLPLAEAFKVEKLSDEVEMRDDQAMIGVGSGQLCDQAMSGEGSGQLRDQAMSGECSGPRVYMRRKYLGY